jgi:hypothetical protein
MPLIKRIDFVLEQRENSELLITQINNSLKIRQKILQVIENTLFCINCLPDLLS